MRNAIDTLVNENGISTDYWINYQLTTTDQLKFELYSTTGQLIEQKNLYGSFRSLRVDCTSYQKGVYFYRVLKRGVMIGSGTLVVY